MIPESFEVETEHVRRALRRREAVERLWPLWDADPGTSGLDFMDPDCLTRWAMRRLADDATRPSDEPFDPDVQAIADCVSALTRWTNEAVPAAWA